MTVIDQPWVHAPESQTILCGLEAAGHQALFVGGCVRNAMLDHPVADIDIATDATPEMVTKLMQAEGLKVIATGADHGTVTVVANRIPHEVTTFRRDVSTDGRRATVAYSGSIEQDARRRDFTMNALYADRQGQVFDPLGGLPDLTARRLRFIEDAGQRIREDYLRTLRFFRFFAWYADPAGGMDADALAAIADNLDGLEQLSRERVGSELLKLLTAPDPSMAVASMAQTGVLLRVLPGAAAEVLPRLVHFEQALGVDPDPIRRLAALGGEVDLRLSKAEMKRLMLLREGVGDVSGAAELGYRYGVDLAVDICLLRAAVMEQPIAADTQAQADFGAAQGFPVKAEDLMPDLSGADLGKQLKHLEARWIASGFALSRDDLLGG